MKSKKSSIKRVIPLLVVVAVVLVALVVTPVLARYIRGTSELPNDFGSKGSVNPAVHNKERTDGKLVGGKLTNVYFSVGKTDYPVYVRVKVIITWKSEEGNVLYWEPEGKVIGAEPETGDNTEETAGGTGESTDGNTEGSGDSTEGEQQEPSYDYTIEYNNADWIYLDDDNDSDNNGYWYYIGTKKNGDKIISKDGVVISQGETTELVKSFNKQEEATAPFDGYELDVEFIIQTVQVVGTTNSDSEKGEILAWQDAWGLKNDFGSDMEPDTGKKEDDGESGGAGNGEGEGDSGSTDDGND